LRFRREEEEVSTLRLTLRLTPERRTSSFSSLRLTPERGPETHGKGITWPREGY